MAKERVLSPAESFIKNSNINNKNYQKLYNESIKNPESFWKKQAEERERYI